MRRKFRKGEGKYLRLTFLDPYIGIERPYIKKNVSFEEVQRRVKVNR